MERQPRVGEQESKPLPVSGRGMEVGLLVYFATFQTTSQVGQFQVARSNIDSAIANIEKSGQNEPMVSFSKTDFIKRMPKIS
jgi:hypothetical protein